MKLAITGKGGAGKTTIAVFLARYLADAGQGVILIDADPDANAAFALGLVDSDGPVPLSELKELIAERTGATGRAGELFTLNPRVDDIPDRFSVHVNGVRLLRMGRLTQGGSGCFCPENAFLKNLLVHLFFSQDQVVILDMEAGIEHLGRGTAQGVDLMLVVVEPGTRSVQTAFSVKEYAADIGLDNVAVVINKYRSDEELARIEGSVSPLPIVGRLPFDEGIAASDLDGACPYSGSEEQRRWVAEVLSEIEAVC